MEAKGLNPALLSFRNGNQTVPVRAAGNSANSLLRIYAFPISWERQLHGELRIAQGVTRQDLDVIRRQLGRILDGIAEGLED